MDVLLLCGYRPKHAIGLPREEHSGELLLDFQIEQVRALGLNPIVVLSGNHSEDHLRQSRLLETCELVYDVHHHEANIFTNIQSGLYATEQACFALPVEILAPQEAAWKHLKTELIKEGFLTQFHVFQLATSEGAPWHYGFPLLLSAVGRKVIMEMKTNMGLNDERLRYCTSKPNIAA